MSLILEALKKLERDKQAPDRGFLVLAHVPWASGSAGHGPRWLWLAGGTFVLALGGLALFRFGGGRPSPAPSPSASPVAAAAPSETRAPSPPVTALAAPAPLPAEPPAPRSSSPQATGAPRAAGTPSPSPQAPADGVELRLNAISQQDGRPVAILNDRLVREGDAFGGIVIVRIGEAEVEVEVDGQRRVVRF
jgi:hypothetical protein